MRSTNTLPMSYRDILNFVNSNPSRRLAIKGSALYIQQDSGLMYLASLREFTLSLIQAAPPNGVSIL